MQHKQNYELQIFPHMKISDHIVVVWFHIFTFFKRSCFQSVIRVISSASLSLIFIWWLSWVPVSMSITMSLSVNSYKHVSMNKSEFFFWLMVAVTPKTNTTIDYATTLVFRILCLLWKTYNFDIIGHVLHLVALGHIFQQCHGDLPHLLVIGILQLSTLCKCDRLSRKQLIAKFISTTAPLNKSQWHLKSVAVAEFFLFFVCDVGGSNPWLTTQH